MKIRSKNNTQTSIEDQNIIIKIQNSKLDHIISSRYGFSYKSWKKKHTRKKIDYIIVFE